MNRKKNKKSAFAVSIIMLIVSAIVITTASFAWFTLGRSAQVDEIDLKVTKQGDGIAISANASSFTDIITYDNLKGVATDNPETKDKNESLYNAISEDFNHFSERISPATSTLACNSLPQFFAGGIDRATSKMIATEATSADGRTINEDAGFYAFDIFVKNGGDADVNVKMSESTITVGAEGDTYEDKGDAGFYGDTVKAMRIGFVNCGTVTEGNTTKATSGTPSVIFAAPDSNARNTSPLSAAGEYTVADGAYTVSSSNSYQCSVDTGSEDVTMTLKPGVNQIRVYIWMEGQDANCTDNLMSQYISANIIMAIV